MPSKSSRLANLFGVFPAGKSEHDTSKSKSLDVSQQDVALDVEGAYNESIESRSEHHEGIEQDATSPASSHQRLGSPHETEPPPDGGMVAWVQVLMMHLVNFNTFGYMLSYGIFQGYYTRVLGFSASDVSWVGTLELFFVYFFGTLSGRLLDAGYFYHILVTGLTLQVIGVFTTSLCTEYWQLLLSQGFCTGIGNGLLFCPAVAHVSTYFSPKRRTVAISFVASGGGTGGLIFPAMAQSLLGKIGFGWTVRAMGFLILFNAVVILSFSKPRITRSKAKALAISTQNRQPLVDWSAFREAPFNIFCAGIFFCFWGLYFAYYYVRSFSRDVLGQDPYDSFTLLLLINGAGIPGRVIPALMADRLRLGPVNVIVPVVLLCGICVFAWIAVHDAVGLYVWDFAYGFVGGGAQSLFQAASSSFAPSIEKVGIRIGMVFTIVSFACLSGPPFGGWLVEVGTGDGKGYLWAQLFGGTTMVLGGFLLAVARVAKTGWILKARM